MFETERTLRAYFSAKAAVLAAGFSDEIDYHARLCLDGIKEPDFLRETAWVILSSGMRESVIAKRFPGISNAFLNWASGEQIVARKESCRVAALAVFRHMPKLDAILDVASFVATHGFEEVHCNIAKHGPRYLERFGFIGPTTSLHLAKNLGFDVVKPDRHLTRIASALGYESPTGLCQDVAAVLGERACIVDLVFWRFATLDSRYLASLSSH